MNRILAYLARNFISVLGVTILTGATVTTSVMGVAKVANTFHQTKLEVPETTSQTQSSSSVSQASSSSSSVAVKNLGTSVLRTSVSSSSTALTTQTGGSSSQAQTGSNRCIITLFGKQFDVTSLQNTHSGGNVFVCGTDQTVLYESRHGTDLSRMQPYLVTSGTGGSGGSVSTGSQPAVKGREKEDDHRDEDQKEEEEVHHESMLPVFQQYDIS